MFIRHLAMPFSALVVLLLLSTGAWAEQAEGTILLDANEKMTTLYQDWQEGVVQDPVTGDYTVTYKTDDGTYAQVTFYPATKIAPRIKSAFKTNDSKESLIIYHYKVGNGKAGRQPLQTFVARVSSVIGSPETPKGWRSYVVPDVVSTFQRLSWTEDSGLSAGLPPGAVLSDFGISSNDLPGIVPVQFKGARPMTMWLAEGPQGTVGDKVAQLKQTDFVSREAAVPLIAVPKPFNGATVLSAIQNHIDQNLIDMKLIDPAFAVQLDRLLQAAADAAKLNNRVAVLGDIKDLRKLLRDQYKDLDKEDNEDVDQDSGNKEKTDKDDVKSRLIDKLAARVLDFDLHYVAKQLTEKEGKDKDD